MKKRIIWKMFLLEIVTFGIYRLYWLIKTRNEMMATDSSIKIKSPWFLLIPIFIIIAAVVVMIGSLITSARSLNTCAPTYTTTNTATPDSNNSNTFTLNSSTNLSTTTTTTNCPVNTSASVTALVTSLVFPLAFIVAFVMYVIWLWGYCQGIETITKDKMSFAISVVILILVPDGIDILIIQDAYNKVPAVGSHTPAHAPAAA